jgi:hypothetical protein
VGGEGTTEVIVGKQIAISNWQFAQAISQLTPRIVIPNEVRNLLFLDPLKQQIPRFARNDKVDKICPGLLIHPWHLSGYPKSKEAQSINFVPLRVPLVSFPA